MHIHKTNYKPNMCATRQFLNKSRNVDITAFYCESQWCGLAGNLPCVSVTKGKELLFSCINK